MYVWFDAGVRKGDESPTLLDKLKKIGDRTIITKCVIRSVYEGDNVAFATKLNSIYEHEKTTDIYFEVREGKKK